MQWIKATERQPEDWKDVHVRDSANKKKVIYLYSQGNLPVFSPAPVGGIEWLDESTELSDYAKQKLEYITGHSIATQFPNVEPHTEWAGAVLDLLKELGLIR